MSSSNDYAGKKPAAAGWHERGGRTGGDIPDLNDPPHGLPGGGGGSGANFDEPRDNYTSGEKSGMLVQNQTERNNVESILEQAREMGAQQDPWSPFDSQSSSSIRFTGTGRLFSGDAQTAPSVPQPPQDVLHNNNGPLRDYDDPENADLIKSIRKSQCPQELQPADPRATFNVNVVKINENYAGVGRTLVGSPADHSPAPPQPIKSTQLRSISDQNEERVLNLLEVRKGKVVESYLCDRLQSNLKEHPLPFLHVRRLALIQLIDERKFDKAGLYFKINIFFPFMNFVPIEQKRLPYASTHYIKREINTCQGWVDNKSRYKAPKNLKGVYWKFAIEIPKDIVSSNSSKRSFRCMVCSEKDFHGCSIGEMENHLRGCPMMTSPFLKRLLNALETKEPVNSQQAEAGQITNDQYYQMLVSELDYADAACQNVELHNSLKKLREYVNGLYATSFGCPHAQAPPGTTTSTSSAVMRPSTSRVQWPSALSFGHVRQSSSLSSEALQFRDSSSHVQSPNSTSFQMPSPSLPSSLFQSSSSAQDLFPTTSPSQSIFPRSSSSPALSARSSIAARSSSSLPDVFANWSAQTQPADHP